ncbi:hypothetical protein [Variovorax paradoxus]|uniref:Uncharacterized protein n=1 Tax=Variovorax paradoxus TaxID=34073 RepID=A0A679IYK1_VARPD|nr:hypothetical protein VVAX_03524 [Variovorax paradoxus]
MYTKFSNYILREDGATIPIDPENADYLAFVEWSADNEPALPTGPTLDQRAAVLLAGVDAHLNAAARAKGYDSILSASVRAALPDSPFHADGVAFGTWMDQVYATCYQLMAAVQAGDAEEPTLEQLIAMLPAAPVFDN